MKKEIHNKKTLNDVIALFRRVHGDRYDYSLITSENYKHTHHKVPIICKEHGVFFQAPIQHYRDKQGCPICATEKTHIKQKGKARHDIRKIKYGVGIYDIDVSCKEEDVWPYYLAWCSMLRRCYDKKNNCWKDCYVCDEWLYFSNFLYWATLENNGFHVGYHLDKDILVKGNKTYSPETCCFVPREINDMVIKKLPQKGHKVGVVKNGNKWVASHGTALLDDFNGYLGRFDSEEEAFAAYKQSKQKYIQQVGLLYYKNNKITRKVFEALMNYKV